MKSPSAPAFKYRSPPPHGLVEIVDLAGVRACDKEGSRVQTLSSCCTDVCFHLGRGKQFLAGDMTTALWTYLILEEDRLCTGAFIRMKKMDDILLIAVSVVGVEDHRQTDAAMISR